MATAYRFCVVVFLFGVSLSFFFFLSFRSTIFFVHPSSLFDCKRCSCLSKENFLSTSPYDITENRVAGNELNGIRYFIRILLLEN